MPGFDRGDVYGEMLQDRSPSGVIPAIGQQNAANIPQNRADLCHA
jgi:hypothetical protein